MAMRPVVGTKLESFKRFTVVRNMDSNIIRNVHVPYVTINCQKATITKRAIVGRVFWPSQCDAPECRGPAEQNWQGNT